MRFWEKLSGTIFRLAALPYLRHFEEKSPEKILGRSLKVLDREAVECLKAYVRKHQADSGGFADKAGRPDLYYSLFGYLIASALEIKEIFPPLTKYVEDEIISGGHDTVHLHCAAILAAGLLPEKKYQPQIRRTVSEHTAREQGAQTSYRIFINLLVCYYLKDYKGLFLIKKQLDRLNYSDSLPATVIAALIVIRKSFKRDVDDLEKKLLSFYNGDGGFKATGMAPVPDLLSTAVALYALNFSGCDLRIIRPACLGFTDSLYNEGGFAGNMIDIDTDIEYTFYGLLALGALAEEK